MTTTPFPIANPTPQSTVQTLDGVMNQPTLTSLPLVNIPKSLKTTSWPFSYHHPFTGSATAGPDASDHFRAINHDVCNEQQVADFIRFFPVARLSNLSVTFVPSSDLRNLPIIVTIGTYPNSITNPSDAASLSMVPSKTVLHAVPMMQNALPPAVTTNCVTDGFTMDSLIKSPMTLTSRPQITVAVHYHGNRPANLNYGRIIYNFSVDV